MEQWKSVVGYEDYYEVSDAGRVRSIDRLGLDRTRDKPRKLKGRSISAYVNNGYPAVRLHKAPNPPRHCYIHRLVAAAFIGPAQKGQEVCHRDGNPLNCSPGNLYWGTSRQNARDAIVHGTMPRGTRHGTSKLTEAAVRSIRADSRVMRFIAADYGVSQAAIQNVKSRKNWGWLA
jgi:hypothetical protein